MAPDYNDGLWHGWNGGECPVHPKTQVQALEQIGVNWNAAAEDCDWRSFKGAFRVVKAYRKPLECWIPIFGNRMGGNYDTEAEAREFTDRSSPTRIALFREVMDGEAQ